MTSIYEKLIDVLKTALRKKGLHISSRVLRRDVSNIQNRITREYIREIQVRGKYCQVVSCKKKLRGRKISFCSDFCRNSYHNREKLNAKMVKNPSYARKRQATWRRGKLMEMRKEYPRLKEIVASQSKHIEEIQKESKELKDKNENLELKLKNIEKCTPPVESLPKSYRLYRPEQER